MPTDYYELLGVSRDATQEDIKRAYRRLARQLHPDTGHGDAQSEARFKEITRAYEVLSDPEKRRRYDAYGPAGVDGSGVSGADPFGFGGGIGDVFEAFFGSSPFGGRRRGPAGPPRGEDLEQVVELEFEEAVFGCQHPVAVKTAVLCDACQATGAAEGTHAVTCHECGGTGQVQRVRQSFIGQMVTSSPCARCGGSGQFIPTPCPVCRGEGRRIQERTYTVDIVAGVDDGSTLRLAGRGAVGPRGGASGDLYVHVRVKLHPRFERQGTDLTTVLELPYTQAALGATIPFETLEGTEELEIPRGTASGTTFRLRGRGVPHIDRRARGDLLINVVVEVPTELTEDEEELVRQLAELRGDEVAPPPAGLLSKLRSAFK
ncbi:MAG TPA: molecular chaperone DnaJ [Acidimicrobiales bacterium]|nr:molecular chaperone DnaJ [Acidimicrobiales bacterium]